MKTIVLAAATVTASAWAEFSNQALPPYSLVHVSAIASPGLALMHESASIGVPSFSGEPHGAAMGTCKNVRVSLLPRAQLLATARAEAFARDLGVTLGPIVRDEPSAKDVAAYEDPFDSTGCGLPKFGRPPFSVAVQQTFRLSASVVVVGAANRATPAPQPTLQFPRQSYEVIAPLVPPASDGPTTVRALGYASHLPDIVTLQVLLAAPAPAVVRSDMQTQHLELLAQTLTAISTVAPHAAIDNEDFEGPMGFNARIVVAHTTVTIAEPDAGLIAKIDRAIAAAHPAGVDVYVTRTERLSTCEAIEEAARRDAIERADDEIRSNGDAGVTLDVAFADDDPIFPFGNFCGPLLDRSLTFRPVRTALEDAAVPLAVGAFDAIELRYRRVAPETNPRASIERSQSR